MYCLSVFKQAIAVVPEPIQLSKTVSPLLVYVLIRYSNKATGFWVGCIKLLLGFLNTCTEVGYLVPSSFFRTFTNSLEPLYAPPSFMIELLTFFRLSIFSSGASVFKGK